MLPPPQPTPVDVVVSECVGVDDVDADDEDMMRVAFGGAVDVPVVDSNGDGGGKS